MKNVSLIVFDFDGTLCDTQRNIVTTLKATIEENRLPERTDEQCVSIIGYPLNECFRQLFPDLNERQVQQCADSYRRIFAEKLANCKPEPFPGVVPTVKLLKQMGLTLTIASSRSHASLVELSCHMGIESCFSLFLGADDVEIAKPNPEPVLKTLRETGFSPEETLVVGDMPVDIRMGKGARAKTVGVTYGNGSRHMLLQAGADFIINSFHELTNIINILEK